MICILNGGVDEHRLFFFVNSNGHLLVFSLACCDELVFGAGLLVFVLPPFSEDLLLLPKLGFGRLFLYLGAMILAISMESQELDVEFALGFVVTSGFLLGLRGLLGLGRGFFVRLGIGIGRGRGFLDLLGLLGLGRGVCVGFGRGSFGFGFGFVWFECGDFGDVECDEIGLVARSGIVDLPN